MKVILLTDQFIDTKKAFIFGGWIQSSIFLLQNSPMIELAVVGLVHEKSCIEEDNNTRYYKINYRKSPNRLKRIYQRFRCKIQDDMVMKDYLGAIRDFNPDIVHIFGLESFLCNLIPALECRCIVHLQGLINPILNAWFPPGVSKNLFYFHSFNLFYFLKGIGQRQGYKTFQAKAKRELEYFRFIRLFMGRTDWDRMITRSLAKEFKYFHLEEVLRSDFYTDLQWNIKNREEVHFISVMSASIYKGLDVILRTAYLLKLRNVRFQWIICGASKNDTVVKTMEKIVKKKYDQQNISFLGKKTPQELIPLLLDADIFIHPSYIENSPNSVCEAQMLGLPVVATNVGGIPSLITDNETGILFPTNDIYLLAEIIVSLLSDPQKMQYLGKNARIAARKRHDREAILENMENIYQEILQM
jgi:glycosyltransferase involved in cell wall biosynthesis